MYKRNLSTLGIFKERLQVFHALSARAVEVDILSPKRREDLHLIACTRNSNIQASLASIAVERTEVHRNLTKLVATIADREEDNIALIALHILQVLYKDWLVHTSCHNLQVGVLAKHFVEHILNQRLLINVECHHTDTLGGGLRVGQAFLNLLHNGLRLLLIITTCTAFVDTLYILERHLRSHIIIRREGHQRVLVEVTIAECYQALVLASVVPQEVFLRHRECETILENALQILAFRVLLAEVLRHKETCRWQLMLVTHDDSALTTRYGGHSLASRHLRRLVKDNQVELWPLRSKILRHRERAHQHCRAHSGDKIRNCLEELADRDSAATITDTLLQISHIRTLGGLLAKCRKHSGHPYNKLTTRNLLELAAQLAETLYLILEEHRMEEVQLIVLRYIVISTMFVEALQVGLDYILRLNLATLESLNHTANFVIAQLLTNNVVTNLTA